MYHACVYVVRALMHIHLIAIAQQSRIIYVNVFVVCKNVLLSSCISIVAAVVDIKCLRTNAAIAECSFVGHGLVRFALSQSRSRMYHECVHAVRALIHV